MIHTFLKRLNEPFPEQPSDRIMLLDFVGVGVFIAAFLYIFKPFGMDNVRENQLLLAMAYGAVTIVFGFSYTLFARYIFKLKTDVPSWTLWKWIVYMLGLLTWIAVGNFGLVVLSDKITMHYWAAFRFMLRNTLLLGVFPVVFSGLMIQLRAARNHQQTAASIARSESGDGVESAAGLISVPVSATENLEISEESFRYAEAMQNYVSLVYTDSGRPRTELIRSTLAGLEERLDSAQIARCHRSYLVNTKAIEHVSGNAQGLKLRLAGVSDLEIPVSRRYVSALKAQLA